MIQEREYWVAFSNFPSIGPVRFGQLIAYFGSAESAWSAEVAELKMAGLGSVISSKFVGFRDKFDIENYVQELIKYRIGFVTYQDKEYPESLKKIDKPPFVLFYKGDVTLLNSTDCKVAVVGTRMVTSYGREVTRLFTSSLVQSSCIVVSGLALGVDALAHMTTLDHKGKTIAVLGCGIECCYPSSNTSLYREIINSGGLVISEYSMNMSPSKGSFPARNRIIAGLSDAILVTEGGEDSGSIITALEGLRYGRKVLAVPGPITSSLSKGPFSLVGHGGVLVTSTTELLNLIGVKNLRKLDKGRKIKGENVKECQIIELLENEKLTFDEIVKKLGFDTSEVGVILSMMEMKGMINSSGSGEYSLT